MPQKFKDSGSDIEKTSFDNYGGEHILKSITETTTVGESIEINSEATENNDFLKTIHGNAILEESNIGNLEYFSIQDSNLDSTHLEKNYQDVSIFIPCNSEDFFIYFEAYTQSDINVAFTSFDGIYDSSGVIDVRVGIVTGISSFRKGAYNPLSRSIFKRQDDFVYAWVNITFWGGVMTIHINDTITTFYSISNHIINQFYIAPMTKLGSYYNGHIGCIIS
ncbi:hypothetical protein AYI68_g2052 [Smittium mucronatum]|uniref:Uncharacterized protein n=1 Tax=Smittium mucronatum TaxID=133383 RepID=A0A1R0H3W8_9FUNG|nr:hypothetical protein AYI68_g2052 [Smittium mucronatum]